MSPQADAEPPTLRRPAPTETDPSHWHLDKRVPVTLIVVLIGQAALGVWFSGRLSQRQDEQERRILTIEQQNVTARLGMLESQLSDLKAGLFRIDSKLDRLIESNGAKR